MIHKVKLKVRDEERWLTSISYSYKIKFSDALDIDKIIQLHQEVSMQLGSQASLPLDGGLIRIRFSSTDHDQFFYEWLFSSMMEDGSIEFIQNEVETIERISFWDCYCVGIKEWMNAGGTPMGIELLLSPAIFKKGALVNEKVWKVTDIHENSEDVNKKSNKKSYNLDTEVAEIEILTPLDTNQYTKTKGFEFEKEYKLRVKSYTKGAPDSINMIKWEYSYISNEGDIVIGSFDNNKGDEILFKVIDENIIDKNVTFYAYIKEKTLGGNCDVHVNPLYYYKGLKRWGRLQSENKDSFAAKGHKYSAQELLNFKEADFWAKTRILDLNKQTEEYVLNKYKVINNVVLSNNDNIEYLVTNNFITGKLHILSFDENSILSKKMRTLPSFQEYYKTYLGVIKDLLSNKAIEKANGKDIEKQFIKKGLSSGLPNFSVTKELISYDNYGIFGGTQKIVLDIEILQFTKCKYKVKTKMHIKDWYGSDWEDIAGTGLKAFGINCFFWLQHHYGYKPFETEVIYHSNDIITINYEKD